MSHQTCGAHAWRANRITAAVVAVVADLSMTSRITE